MKKTEIVDADNNVKTKQGDRHRVKLPKVCQCFAHSEDECQCGAWHKKPELSVTIRQLRKMFKKAALQDDHYLIKLGSNWCIFTKYERNMILSAATRAAKENEK